MIQLLWNILYQFLLWSFFSRLSKRYLIVELYKVELKEKIATLEQQPANVTIDQNVANPQGT